MKFQSYVLDKQQRTLALQIPIAVYNQIEEILEDFGLVKLMEEVEDDEGLSGDATQLYYDSLKKYNTGSRLY